MKYVVINGNGNCKLMCTNCGTVNIVPRYEVMPGMTMCKACGKKNFQLVNAKRLRKLNGQTQNSFA